MAAARHLLRSHILALFARGEIVTIREASLICDASPQAIRKWVKAAGIDLEASRLAYIARQRSRAQLIAEGRAPRGKPSKAQMRQIITDAMARTRKKANRIRLN